MGATYAYGTKHHQKEHAPAYAKVPQDLQQSCQGSEDPRENV